MKQNIISGFICAFAYLFLHYKTSLKFCSKHDS